METDPTHLLPLMLEAVDELVNLLELQKSLLSEGRESPDELSRRLALASDGVGELAERLREAPPPTPSAEARALKARLEQRFVLAFKLTRENERILKNPAGANAPNPGQSAAPGRRKSLREIEKCYRERMQLRTPAGSLAAAART